MQALVIHPSGQIEERDVTRKSLATEFEFYLRDLRPVMTGRNLITISPHKQALVLNLGLLRVIIGQHEAIFPVPANTDTFQQFIERLQEVIRRNPEEQLNFALLVLETALEFKIGKLRSEFDSLERDIEKALHTIQKTLPTDQKLERLLLRKKQLLRFESRVTQLEEVLSEILGDEDEMQRFYLGAGDARDALEEIESILDAFSEPAEELVDKVRELKESMDDTQEFLSMKLQARRNVIIRLDLLATLVTAVFSLLAVITGLYGMNLRNSLEDHDQAFLWVAGGIGLLLLSSCWYGWRVIKRYKIF